jgi:ParB/RepB/Spo0J family partition protein
MAVKINATGVGRADMYFILPNEIHVDEVVNGRWMPHDDATVMELVESYKTVGQLQPVTVRKIDDNKVCLVMGYRRWKAACKFNELHPDKPMKLKCVLNALTPEEALVRNIAENRERKETTCIDDAYNMRRLREEYGWTDTKVAEFFKVTQTYVSQLKKVLTLAIDLQMKVHKKELSLQSALALADLPVEEQKAVMVEATSDKGETKTKDVVASVRKKKVSRGKSQARTLSEVREFFEGLTGPVDECKPLAELVLRFIAGSIADTDMGKDLLDIVKGTVKLQPLQPLQPMSDLEAAVAAGVITQEEADAMAKAMAEAA